MKLAPNSSYDAGQWVAPAPFLHLTLLEVTHSTSPPALAALLAVPLLQSTLAKLPDIPATLPCTLYRPQLNVDPTALSLSFLPRASAASPSTYHHLRRALFASYHSSGAAPASNARYVHPSAHITLARFLRPLDPCALVEAVADVNAWLAQLGDDEGVWSVGEEGGVQVRTGPVWYGGGDVFARATTLAGAT